MSDLHLDFYGVRVRMRCSDDQVSTRVANDFFYFVVNEADCPQAGEPHIAINAYLQPPDYQSLPPLKATVYSPRNICYTNGHVTFIDYFGRVTPSPKLDPVFVRESSRP